MTDDQIRDLIADESWDELTIAEAEVPRFSLCSLNATVIAIDKSSPAAAQSSIEGVAANDRHDGNRSDWTAKLHLAYLPTRAI